MIDKLEQIKKKYGDQEQHFSHLPMHRLNWMIETIEGLRDLQKSITDFLEKFEPLLTDEFIDNIDEKTKLQLLNLSQICERKIDIASVKGWILDD